MLNRCDIVDSLHRAWLVIRHRPVMVCPFCEGRGGEVSGYYEPEWTECWSCHEHWDALDELGVRWAVGRMPFWMWVRSKAAIRCKLWFPARLRDPLRCWLGFHQFISHGENMPCLCRICWSENEKKAATESVSSADEN